MRELCLIATVACILASSVGGRVLSLSPLAVALSLVLLLLGALGVVVFLSVRESMAHYLATAHASLYMQRYAVGRRLVSRAPPIGAAADA